MTMRMPDGRLLLPLLALLTGCAESGPSLEYSALVAEPPDFQPNANPAYHYPEPEHVAADVDVVRPVVDLPDAATEPSSDAAAAGGADGGSQPNAKGQVNHDARNPTAMSGGSEMDANAVSPETAATEDPAATDNPTADASVAADTAAEPVLADAAESGEPREIPHGLYEVESPATDESVRATTRSTLALPEDAYVLLSFGHIRDGKNLHLMLQSLSADKNQYLLVVGREQSTTQKPVSWYQQQAQQLGVADRCRWINEFVPDSDVHMYFSAADAAVLLYSADFRSASGVLNNVAQFELPVLCSSGGGPLQGLIDRYNLGVWVKPDCLQAARAGLQQLRQVNPAHQGWASYREDHSWDRNARLIRLALDTTPQTEIGKVGVS